MMTKQEMAQKIQKLKDAGYEGYYDYFVVGLDDAQNGAITPIDIAENLLKFAVEGWRLKFIFTNELGRNTSSGGFGGFSTGTNATIERNFLIFERYVKI